LKDMIVSGSENIYPAEIELAVSGHPGVAEVAVVGKADNKWGEIPVAFVVRKQGEKVSEQDIINICRENLAGYKRVKEVRFIDSLPKNALMKVLKQTLRNQLK
ncbi:MAG: AMP-dependent synthetase, partial [Deltaproteobacteria bacterium]|nr:AMP-dependent synthetase [Deltaproteobacteria bacterium]